MACGKDGGGGNGGNNNGVINWRKYGWLAHQAGMREGSGVKITAWLVLAAAYGENKSTSKWRKRKRRRRGKSSIRGKYQEMKSK